jgi:hypothetical protein
MPKAGACCENGAVSAAAQPVEPPESDRSKESDAAISALHACDFPAANLRKSYERQPGIHNSSTDRTYTLSIPALQTHTTADRRNILNDISRSPIFTRGRPVTNKNVNSSVFRLTLGVFHQYRLTTAFRFETIQPKHSTTLGWLFYSFVSGLQCRKGDFIGTFSAVQCYQ